MKKLVSSKNNKGLSAVVGAMIMIVLVVSAVALVWVVVNNLISDQISSESCAGNYEEITINDRYTCHESSSGDFQFSISIGDIDINSITISISETGTTNSYILNNTNQSISGLGPYPSGSGNVKLPDKNAGLTYIASGYSTKPDAIEISPKIGGRQCGVSDSLYQLDDCSTFT